MIATIRTAALAALLSLGAVPATAQDPLAPPAWDARLTPPPAASHDANADLARALPPEIGGAGLMALGVALMYVTKQAEGGDGEEGVPILPLLSGTMGAMTFWYGVYKIAGGR